jgi:hypothetical protein
LKNLERLEASLLPDKVEFLEHGIAHGVRLAKCLEVILGSRGEVLLVDKLLEVDFVGEDDLRGERCERFVSAGQNMWKSHARPSGDSRSNPHGRRCSRRSCSSCR